MSAALYHDSTWDREVLGIRFLLPLLRRAVSVVRHLLLHSPRPQVNDCLSTGSSAHPYLNLSPSKDRL